MNRHWIIVITALIFLGFLALLSFLAGCVRDLDTELNYECTVDNVQGVFLNDYAGILRADTTMTMYRLTDHNKKRTFMFPTHRVQCQEREIGQDYNQD